MLFLILLQFIILKIHRSELKFQPLLMVTLTTLKPYLKKENFSFDTETEKQLKKTLEAAEKEKIDQNIKTEYDNLMNALRKAMNYKSIKNQTEIKNLILDELIKRYQYKEGLYQYYVHHNSEVKKATSLLANTMNTTKYFKNDKIQLYNHIIINQFFRLLAQEEMVQSIYFDTNKSDVEARQTKLLVDFIKKTDSTRIESIQIFGYCDDVGKDEYNRKLSTERANNVKSEITGNGIKNKIIVTIEGKGRILIEDDIVDNLPDVRSKTVG